VDVEWFVCEENQMRYGELCEIPPFAKAAKDGAPTVWWIKGKAGKAGHPAIVEASHGLFEDEVCDASFKIPIDHCESGEIVRGVDTHRHDDPAAERKHGA
jgi:hypothetical protein